MEKAAQKILDIFNKATLQRDSIDSLAWFVWFNAEVTVLAKIIYFCEKVLSHGDK
jgi:hypothetical protein